MNRLPVEYSIPTRYSRSDFQDIIDRLISETGLRVHDGFITFAAINRTATVDRFGRTFNVELNAFGGHVFIDIKES